jgi:hypothetical protein
MTLHYLEAVRGDLYRHADNLEPDSATRADLLLAAALVGRAIDTSRNLEAAIAQLVDETAYLEIETRPGAPRYDLEAVRRSAAADAAFV